MNNTMTIFAMTDLHGSLRALDTVKEQIAAADLLLVCGDITNFGDRSEAKEIIDRLMEVNATLFAVAGNCDREGVEAYLTERGINLHGRLRTHEGIALAGLGGSLPGPGPTPNTASEEELGAVLAGIPDSDGAPLVLVSHQPPFDTAADVISSGRHVGSRSVRSFIEERRPLLCLSGHIHESIGQSDLEGCRVVNAGPFGSGRYALIEVSEGVTVGLHGE